MTRPRVVVAVLIGFLCLGLALAGPLPADPALADARLNDKKYDFNTRIRDIRQKIEADLKTRESEARKAGGETVKQIKAEREEFKKSGKLPASLEPAIAEEYRAARSDLAEAYENLARLLRKQDLESKAAELESELARVPEDALPPYQPLEYWMTVGSDWAGQRSTQSINNRDAGDNVRMRLTVTARKGRQIAGELTLVKVGSTQFTGNVNGDKIVFTNTGAQPNYEYEGEFDGKDIRVVFKGVGAAGRTRTGTATLSRQPEFAPRGKRD